MNEKFSRLADKVSEMMGRWWTTAIALLIVILWLISGPFLQWSTVWHLLINDTTNVVSLLLLFIVAASANRVDRHNAAMQQRQQEALERINYIIDKLMEVMGGVHELVEHDIEVTEHDSAVTEAVSEHIRKGD